MLPNPSCPVCSEADWTVVGERTYPRPPSLAESRKPLRVLFEMWAPEQDSFHVDFVVCRACAMMIYLPRPSSDDLDAKYRALAGYGDNTPSLGESPSRTRQRSERLHRILADHLPEPVANWRILDFGGGDGRLLTTFVERGATCEVIDYCEAMVPGVRHIGRTVDALPDRPTYDAIVCSHVVEHLAEPLPVLQRLVKNLRGGGVMYVEVPVEVVKRLPAQIEPVTHCNFFIPESLGTLMERAGTRLLRNGLTAYPHPNGTWMLCAGSVGTPGAVEPNAQGAAAIQRYLRPSLPFLIRLRAITWRSLPRLVLRKIEARLRAAAS